MREIGAGNNCIEPITIMKQKIYDFADINDEFLEELREKLDELFDPDKPFEPTPDEKACRYCKFTQICGRNPINS
jgi:CRISPR/Cas system-associated exonuclease Cas4 (RecB family)